jgi:hypothetical protein
VYASAITTAIRAAMRTTALAALLVSLAATASAQTVEVRPVLRTGDNFRLEFTRVREDSAQPDRNTRGTTPVEVRVIHAGADGITLEWEPAETQLPAGQVPPDPLLKAASDAVSGLRLRVALAADGEVRELLNQAEVLPRLQQVVDIVVNGLLPTVPAEQRPQVQQLLGQVLSPTFLLGSAMQQVETYFALHSGSFTPGEPVVASLEQLNPLGGGPIPASLRVVVESATGESAVLRTSVTYEASALVRSMQTLAQQAGGPPITDADIAALKLEVTDDGRFVLDRKLGLMREVTVDRRIVAGPQTRVDRTDVRLVRAPVR